MGAPLVRRQIQVSMSNANDISSNHGLRSVVQGAPPWAWVLRPPPPPRAGAHWAPPVVEGAAAAAARARPAHGEDEGGGPCRGGGLSPAHRHFGAAGRGAVSEAFLFHHSTSTRQDSSTAKHVSSAKVIGRGTKLLGHQQAWKINVLLHLCWSTMAGPGLA
jgi:hypothetical protein